jgi:hypothetical protein
LTWERSHRRIEAGTEPAPTSTSQWPLFLSFQISLRPRWRSVVFGLMVALSAGYFGAKVVRTALVATLGEFVDRARLQRAISMDPSDPELHHRLGMLLSDSVAEGDRKAGLEHLRRAIDLEPQAARYWSDLASACELSGDISCATESVEQAVKLSPMTPQIRWVAANTLLRAGRTDEAMAEFRRLLELDPSYAPATFHVCLGALEDPQLVLHKVMPAGTDPRVKLDYLNFLIANGLTDQARKVWSALVASGKPFQLSLAKPYLDQLFASGRFDDAHNAWLDLERLGIVPGLTAGPEGNLVYNGDFEHTPLGIGFDWRIQGGPYLALDFSDATAHKGKYCLRIDFTVSRNEEYTLLYELVPVASSLAYRLTADVRSQDITSDSGPRLRVVDPIRPHELDIMGEPAVGTSAWHLISLEFSTGPDTKIVQLSVTRPRSRTFPMEITGSFWLDTVVLRPAALADTKPCVESGCR